jgi:hypothetical protein
MVVEGKVPFDYDGLCRQWSDDEESCEGWRELRLALGNRSGWWFLDPRQLAGYDGGPLWCFGARDQAKLCVTPMSGGFEVYEADRDEEVSFEVIGDVVAWIDAHEPDEGLSPMLQQMLNRDADPRWRGR